MEKYSTQDTQVLVKSERGGVGVWRGSERELRFDRDIVYATWRYDILTVLVRPSHIRYKGTLRLRRIARRGEFARDLRQRLLDL